MNDGDTRTRFVAMIVLSSGQLLSFKGSGMPFFSFFFLRWEGGKWRDGGDGVLKLGRLVVWIGNRQAREATEPFFIPTQRECSHFIFSNTVCITMLVYYTAYLAPLALFPCRGIFRCTDKRTLCKFVQLGFLNYATLNFTFRRTGMLISRSPIVVVQLQTVGNMWNWRKQASMKFCCQGPVLDMCRPQDPPFQAFFPHFGVPSFQALFTSRAPVIVFNKLLHFQAQFFPILTKLQLPRRKFLQKICSVDAILLKTVVVHAYQKIIRTPPPPRWRNRELWTWFDVIVWACCLVSALFLFCSPEVGKGASDCYHGDIGA